MAAHVRRLSLANFQLPTRSRRRGRLPEHCTAAGVDARALLLPHPPPAPRARPETSNSLHPNQIRPSLEINWIYARGASLLLLLRTVELKGCYRSFPLWYLMNRFKIYIWRVRCGYNHGGFGMNWEGTRMERDSCGFFVILHPHCCCCCA